MHRSYFRCYVVHATSFATLKNNVAFNSQGHCYYLEDGVEEQNVIDRNLAMFVNILGTVSVTVMAMVWEGFGGWAVSGVPECGEPPQGR